MRPPIGELARLQQRIVFGLLALAALCFALLLQLGWAWAVVGTALLLYGHAAVLAIEFALMRAVNRRSHEPPATLRQVIGAWWAESRTAPLVFCWRQPFRSNAVPDHLPTAAGRRGVVFVHGFVCNRGLWNPWLSRLQDDGVPFAAVNLEPVFGSIDDYVACVEAGVRRVEAATGLPPVIVAHSMGGLATRAWLDRHAADARVHHVVTIGSPHRGTLLGRIAAHSPNARQMALDSGWLHALAGREPPQRLERFTCFYGHCDNIVFPASTATLPGADNRHIPGCAHVQMALHGEVVAEAMRWVSGERAALAAPADAAAR